MKKVFNVSLILFLLFTFSTSIFGQKINFSGEWKYNPDKCEIPRGINIHVPESIKLIHKDNDLTFVAGSGEKKSEKKYTLDGKEVKNKTSKGSVITSICKWNGDTIVIESTRLTGYGDFKMTEKYSLSKDGKTLINIMTTSFTYDQEIKHVYDRVK